MQAGALWVSDPPAHCQGGGVEARVLGGVNLPHNSFLNAEAAERILSGGCTDQRVEVTAGVHAGRHWMGLAQVFVEGSQYGDETVKAELSLVHFDNQATVSRSACAIASTAVKTNSRSAVAFWTEPGRARRRQRQHD